MLLFAGRWSDFNNFLPQRASTLMAQRLSSRTGMRAVRSAAPRAGQLAGPPVSNTRPALTLNSASSANWVPASTYRGEYFDGTAPFGYDCHGGANQLWLLHAW
jgi:hypothetical protein